VANHGSLHVQRVAPWIDIMVSGLRLLGVTVHQYRLRQATWTYGGRTFWARYRHPHQVKPFGAVEVSVGLSIRTARVQCRIKSVHDAVKFYNDCNRQARLASTGPLRLLKGA
jgi:hypothetical protein